MDEIAHVLGDPERFAQTKKIAEALLTPKGLNWDEVEDIVLMGPMQEFYIEYHRPQFNNDRHAVVCLGSSVS